MKPTSTFFLLFVFLTGASLAQRGKKKVTLEGPVEIASEEQLEEVLTQPLAFICFYSYEDGSSYKEAWDKIRGHYAMAAKNLLKDDHPIKMYQLNVDEVPGVQEKYDVTPYPMFKLFTYGKGREQRYNLPRSESEIVPWVLKEFHQISKEIKTEEKLQRIWKEHCHVIIYFGPPLTETFKEFAHASVIFEDDVMFYHVNEPELIRKFAPGKQTENPQIVFYEEFGSESFEFYAESYDSETIKDFILHNIHHQLNDHSTHLHQKIMQERIPTLILVVSDNEKSKKAKKAMAEVAPKLERKILMSVVDWYKPEFSKYYHLDSIKVEETPVCFILSFYNSTRAKYRYRRKEITAEGLEEFYWQWKNKTIKPMILDVLRSLRMPKPGEKDTTSIIRVESLSIIAFKVSGFGKGAVDPGIHFPRRSARDQKRHFGDALRRKK